MKYLIKKIDGLYDINNNKIESKLNIHDTIIKYGFSLNSISNMETLIGNRLVCSDNTSTVIKINNQNSFVLINKDFDKYDNLVFDSNVSVAVSDDGVNWRIMIDEESYTKFISNINLSTIDTTKLSQNDKTSYLNLIESLNNFSKNITRIKNNKYIKHIIIKFNTNILNISYDIYPSNDNTVIDDSLNISYTNNKTVIKNNKSTNINTLILKINQTNYIKDTLCEF